MTERKETESMPGARIGVIAYLLGATASIGGLALEDPPRSEGPDSVRCRYARSGSTDRLRGGAAG